MKIVFRNLPEGEGTVKVSLDGGNTFIDHQINTVRENGIPLADNQDYSKILIKGSANILRNLDILSSVKVDGAAQSSSNIEWYAWALPDNEGVIYTKTINSTGQCIAYQRMDSNFIILDYSNQPGTHYFELSDEGTLLERVYNYKPGHTNVLERCPSEDIEAIAGIPYTYEKPVYGLGTVTYRCYAFDQNTDGQITEDDNVPTNYHLWVKTIDGKNMVYGIDPSGLTTDVSNLIEMSKLIPPSSDWLANITINEDLVVFAGGNYIRYPEGDLTNEEETVVGTETVTETIKFIQDPPTVTENGTVIADEGKAFKLANVEVPKSELGFKCFYSYAPNHYFGEVPEAVQALDSGDRYYNILMSNDYLSRMYKRVFPSRTYNGVVGLIGYDFRGNEILNNYQTLSSEYNLFSLQTKVGRTTVQLTFYDDLNASERQEAQIKVYLDSGEEYTVPTKERPIDQLA